MVEIREARPDDAEACAAVHVASWQAAYRGMVPDDDLDALRPERRLAGWQDWLGRDRPRGAVLLAVEDGEVVGFGSFVPHPELSGGWALVPQLYLGPAAIGRGIGAALMAAGPDRLRADGFTRVELWVHPDSDRARRFYERGGWTSDGTVQVEEVWGVRLPELRMVRDL